MKLFGDVNDEIFKQVSALSRNILTFRKVLLASRELMHELASRRSPFISETTQPFLDLMAGTLERLGNDLATERDMLSETLNLYMGMTSHRTGHILKRLTMSSIIFLPLTFLCGVYGMNFQYMPEISLLIILIPLKINNLQATENCKMARIKVFRQARFFL